MQKGRLCKHRLEQTSLILVQETLLYFLGGAKASFSSGRPFGSQRFGRQHKPEWFSAASFRDPRI